LRSSSKHLPDKVRNFIPDTIKTLAHSINAIKSTTQRPYATADIGSMKLKCLFDTGADVSCIKTSTFAQTQLTKVPFESSVAKNFRAAGGQKLQLSGKATLPIQIDRKTVHHPFYLIDNLNEDCILGIDFITEHSLNYCPQNRQFFWPGDKQWVNGIITMSQSDIIPALSSKVIKVNVITDLQTKPSNNSIISACVGSELKPLLTSVPCLSEVNSDGKINILIKNCAPVDISLDRDEIIGKTENLCDSDFVQLDPLAFKTMEDIYSIAKKPISKDTDKFIRENVKLNVPSAEKDSYLNLLCEHWETFSLDKHDLGLCKVLQHDIELKTKEPIYVKQFKIPEAHMSEVKTQLAEWLKLGVVEPCRSKYNSPIFVVAKKDGGLRIVQDFRALNSETFVDKYSMQDVNECVAEIGRSGSTIFSTLDLTSGFWQMQLHPEAKKTTAFTIPGVGQFCWKVAPMGLLGSPASFQRLVETVLKDIPNVIVYIDDLIIHTGSHRKHRETLRLVFDRLRANNLKVNLKKCEFGSPNVSYLGFRLTPEGIKPGLDKLKAVGKTLPPTSVKEVRQFLGLCNFFRSHVKNFALITHPLTKLTTKESPWKRGPLQPEALKAFRELQTILCSEPVIDYPRKNRQYVLITDASFGDEKTPGGLGAILSQVDDKGKYYVIAYASRKLAKHEQNYTPFLLEMQAALWAMDHFHVYLKGNHFTLMTDHKPMETLGTIHTKTLNRLQEAMNTIYSFNIVYKKGSEMPADFLSRHAIDSISWDNLSLQRAQQEDPLLTAIINFLYNRMLPDTTNLQSLVRTYANDCFMENGLLWRRLKRQGETPQIVLFVPQNMKQDILAEAHGGQFTGHDGIYKTRERILQCYYWPGMDRDINDFIKSCVKCQQRVKNNKTNNTLLQPLPQCSTPNQRIHADLFGPLKTSGSGKKHILCITDAMTKYVELVAIPDKEAQTVAEAIFNRWICRYGSPLQITTDGGKEFCSKLSDRLYDLMKIDHLTTSPYHPQCNSQAEVVNKTIAKYLSSFVDQTTLDWELYLPPLMFAYNTSIHSTTKFSPFFLTFGQKPRAPHFPAPDLTRTFYGESTIDEMWLRLQQARKIAIANNEQVRDTYEQNFNDKVNPTNYVIGQQVFLDEHNFLNKNRKLAPKYSGPHVIQKLLHGTNAQIKLKNGRSTIVHLNRLKPFLSNNDQMVENETVVTNQQNSQIVPFDLDEDNSPPPPFHTFCKTPNLLPTLPTHPPSQPIVAPAKRGRGRPKKSVSAPSGEKESERREEINIPPPSEHVTETPKQNIVTRSQLKQMSEAQKAEYFAVNFLSCVEKINALLSDQNFQNNFSKQKLNQSDKNIQQCAQNNKILSKFCADISECEIKRNFFAQNFVSSVKRLKKKRKQHGSTNTGWTKNQKRAFRLYGDIYGPTVRADERLVDQGNPHPVAIINPPVEPGEGNDPGGDAEPEQSDSDSFLSGSDDSDSDPGGFDLFDHDQPGLQGDLGQPHQAGGNKPPDIHVPEAPQAQVQPQHHGGALPPLQPQQLPLLQRLKQLVVPYPDRAIAEPHQIPPPAVQLPQPKNMPARAQPNPPDPVPPPPIQPDAPPRHQDLLGGEIPVGGLPHPMQIQVGRARHPLSKEDSSHTIDSPKASPHSMARSASPGKTLPTARFKTSYPVKRQHEDASALAGFSRTPSPTSRQKTRPHSAGDLTGHSLAEQLSPMASPSAQSPVPRIGPRENLENTPGTSHSTAGPRSPQQLAQEEARRDERVNKLLKARKTHLELKEHLERMKAGSPLTTPRPTRSTYKAPDIPPLPSVPMEYRRRQHQSDSDSD